MILRVWIRFLITKIHILMGIALAEREPHRQNGNSTGRTGNRICRTGIVGKGLCDRPQLRTPANNKSIYGSTKIHGKGGIS